MMSYSLFVMKKKKKKLDELVLEYKSNDFGWKIPCKIKTFKADE